VQRLKRTFGYECGVLAGVKTEQLHRVIEVRDLGSPEFVIIHVGTTDMNIKRNLDFVKEAVYALASTAKRKFPNCRLVLSGVLRPSDVCVMAAYWST